VQATEEITTVESAAPDQTPAAPAAEDWPGGSGEPSKAARNAGINAWIRGGEAEPTLKPAESAPAEGSTPADNGQTGDVKPAERAVDPLRESMTRGGVPRRGVLKAAETAEQKAAVLEAKLAEMDPAKIEEQVRAKIAAEQAQQAEAAKLDDLSKSQRANVEKYRRLNDLPDWKLEKDDRDWLNEFKDKLDLLPEVREFHQTDAEMRIEAAAKAQEQALRTALQRHVSKPGVDPDTFRKLGEWGALGDHLYDAGGKARQPEIDQRDARIAELEGTIRQLTVSGNGGLGAGRDLAPAGRSSSVIPKDGNAAMNDWLRGV
jgi:hypothetical protein